MCWLVTSLPAALQNEELDSQEVIYFRVCSSEYGHRNAHEQVLRNEAYLHVALGVAKRVKDTSRVACTTWSQKCWDGVFLGRPLTSCLCSRKGSTSDRAATGLEDLYIKTTCN